jgi:hypothetical protein
LRARHPVCITRFTGEPGADRTDPFNAAAATARPVILSQARVLPHLPGCRAAAGVQCEALVGDGAGVLRFGLLDFARADGSADDLAAAKTKLSVPPVIAPVDRLGAKVS